MRVLFCESCGAPLDAPWAELVIVCPHCGSQNLPGSPRGYVPPREPVDGRPRLNLGGRTYVLEGRLGEGSSSIVYRGRWVMRLGELVTVKVQSAPDDDDLLRREWRTLSALARAEAPGAHHFRTRLPSPIAHGLVDTDRPRVASVFGWKSGFVHTLEEVGEHYPEGVPGVIQVWILKRLLELLGFLHRAGTVHGAVTPDHVLIHPRDHGALLVGWTLATPWASGRTQRLPAVPTAWQSLYPSREATPNLDILLACRCAEASAGWHLPGATRVPAIQAVLARGLSGREDDAWALRDALVEASLEAYGPPAYNPLPLPGWS